MIGSGDAVRDADVSMEGPDVRILRESDVRLSLGKIEKVDLAAEDMSG